MPALITHDTFGQDIYHDLFSTIGKTRDEAEAFLLGNQGPDPLFYAITSPRLRKAHTLGTRMHNERPNELLVAFKQAISLLDEKDQPLGRAYALGFLCHYILDTSLHPFILFQEYQLCDAGEPGLSRTDCSEVHAIIECELDEMVLFAKSGATIATFDPSQKILKASKKVLTAVSLMYSYVALVVYGLIIPENSFSLSVKRFRRAQAFLHSPSGTKRALVSRLEEIVRPYSFYRCMSHRPIALEESAFANKDHTLWENPFTGANSAQSFWDCYEKARKEAFRAFRIFDREDFGMEQAREITHNFDFSGKPTDATLVAAENKTATSCSCA